MDSKLIVTIVVVVGLLAFAGYMAYKFIQTIPAAIELNDAINNVDKPTQEQTDSVQSQRNEAQQKFNSLLDGNE